MNTIKTSKEIVNKRTNEVLTVGEACDAFANMIENIQDILTECGKIDPIVSDNLQVALCKIADLVSEYKIGRSLYVRA